MPTEDRLQPSLLDRLTDDDPRSTQESRDRRVLSLAKVREAVIRDLNWLLNTSRLSDHRDLSAFPVVEHSVLNYGMPDLTGKTSSSLNVREIEQLVKEAILDFEPRILAEGLEVHAVADETAMSHAALRIDIRGALWSQPLPQELYLRTMLDLETGQCSVDESRGGSQP